MIELALEAQEMLEEYVRRLRSALRRCPSTDAAEIESEVLGRIERELSTEDRPVAAAALEAVLGELGNPTRWVPPEHHSWWRRVLRRLQTGPGDHRLAALTFGPFLPALALLVLSPPAGAALLLAVCVLARAAVSVSADEGRIRPDRWLTYPPLILTYLLLAGAVLLWPGPATWRFLQNYFRGEYGTVRLPWPRSESHGVILGTWCSVAVTACWWGIVGLVCKPLRRQLAVVFSPFVTRGRARRIGGYLMWGGLILLSAATVMVALVLV